MTLEWMMTYSWPMCTIHFFGSLTESFAWSLLETKGEHFYFCCHECEQSNMKLAILRKRSHPLTWQHAFPYSLGHIKIICSNCLDKSQWFKWSYWIIFWKIEATKWIPDCLGEVETNTIPSIWKEKERKKIPSGLDQLWIWIQIQI